MNADKGKEMRSHRLNTVQTRSGMGKENCQANEDQGNNKAVTGGMNVWSCRVFPEFTVYYRWILPLVTACYWINRCKSLMSRVCHVGGAEFEVPNIRIWSAECGKGRGLGAGEAGRG